MTEHEAFLEWFNERENYSLRSDRFYEEAGHGMDLLPWLQAAFSMGARYEREACLDAVEKSRVIEFVVYPKDYMISRNDVPRCYDFQHARTIKAIKARGAE